MVATIHYLYSVMGDQQRVSIMVFISLLHNYWDPVRPKVTNSVYDRVLTHTREHMTAYIYVQVGM